MKNERFYNLRINSFFKHFVCIFCCFILIVSIFPYNIALASTYNFPELNVTTSNNVNEIINGSEYYSFSSTDGFYISATEPGIYYFFVPTSGSNYNIIAASESPSVSSLRSVRKSTEVLSTKACNSTQYFDSYNLYFGNFGFNVAFELHDPLFNDIESGIVALRDFLDNPSSSDPIYDDLPNFNIQRGYAAYIDFGSDWSTRSISGTLTSSFPQYSSLISGDWDGTDNRRYFWTDSLPSNTNFTSNVGSAIDWTKVPPYDLLQRSKNGIWFIQSNSPLNRYLVIVNPNQWRYGQNPTDDTINSPITVSDLSGSTGDVKFFALNQKFDSDGTLVSAASDNASNNRTGTYNPDTSQWEMTDPNGNAADQVPGGESDTPVISSISDYIHNITSVLTNFANSVISLIQAPISHISELIDAGSGFMQALRGMYAWLPVDIQGLVISALSVVIGIGIFKVFL